jgi:hypothetical protein
VHVAAPSSAAAPTSSWSSGIHWDRSRQLGLAFRSIAICFDWQRVFDCIAVAIQRRLENAYPVAWEMQSAYEGFGRAAGSLDMTSWPVVVEDSWSQVFVSKFGFESAEDFLGSMCCSLFCQPPSVAVLVDTIVEFGCILRVLE